MMKKFSDCMCILRQLAVLNDSTELFITVLCGSFKAVPVFDCMWEK